MRSSAAPAPPFDEAGPAAPPGRRLIGRYRGGRPGPLVLAIGGLHGNEPAGVHALRRVFSALEETRPPMSGEFLGLAGNLLALRAGVRFLRHDLNRAWRPRRIAELRAGRLHAPEDEEQLRLLSAIEEALGGREDDAYVLDLHTTSADSAPFLTLGDTIRNRTFAGRLELPLVLGIEEQIGGALLDLLNRRGTVTVGVEGGRHDDPRSVDYHEAVLWLALVESGCLASADVEGLEDRRRFLAGARADLPGVFEVRTRHGVKPGDGFVMRPGYANFQRVRKEEVLARDRGGPIPAPEDGRIFLPLYQELGDDGFLLVRSVRPVWLRVSAALRRLHLDGLAPLLPGVRRSRRRVDTLIVDRRIARWLVVEIFHLLGYRRGRSAQRSIVFSRRGRDRPPRGRR
ncbi:MAG: succinylglutamate desuccinylase/aspartoacylase family protein [Gemmatimonadota bacterium]